MKSTKPSACFHAEHKIEIISMWIAWCSNCGAWGNAQTTENGRIVKVWNEPAQARRTRSKAFDLFRAKQKAAAEKAGTT